ETHRAAKLLGLPAAESRGHHRHPQQLLLKQRHAKRAREDWLQRWMRVDDRLTAGASIQVRVHHLPDDRTRADDRDLDDEVVKDLRLQARQRRHLRARLDLKEAYGIGFLQHLVNAIVFG